jgi:hypothetical protein
MHGSLDLSNSRQKALSIGEVCADELFDSIELLQFSERLDEVKEESWTIFIAQRILDAIYIALRK